PEDKLSLRKGVGKALEPALGKGLYSEDEQNDVNIRIVKGIKKSQTFNQKNINAICKPIYEKYANNPNFDFVDFIDDIVYTYIFFLFIFFIVIFLLKIKKKGN